MPLFHKRHYEWLSRFAAETLDLQQVGLLANELARDNSSFNRTRFLNATKKLADEYGSELILFKRSCRTGAV